MSLDLSYSAEQQALADSVRGHCERTLAMPHVDGSASVAVDPLPAGYWSGLAELGVLALGTPEGGGGCLEICAAMEALGTAAAPGPLVGQFLATALLAPDDRSPLTTGTGLVAVGCPPLLPWAAAATTFVELADHHAWLARPLGAPEPVETTAGEPWARVELERVSDLGDPRLAVARGQVALAAYLVGAGRHLLAVSVEYARDRVQFGRPIGSFQAVAHPLADRATSLQAASILVLSLIHI